MRVLSILAAVGQANSAQGTQQQPAPAQDTQQNSTNVTASEKYTNFYRFVIAMALIVGFLILLAYTITNPSAVINPTALAALFTSWIAAIVGFYFFQQQASSANQQANTAHQNAGTAQANAKLTKITAQNTLENLQSKVNSMSNHVKNLAPSVRAQTDANVIAAHSQLDDQIREASEAISAALDKINHL